MKSWRRLNVICANTKDASWKNTLTQIMEQKSVWPGWNTTGCFIYVFTVASSANKNMELLLMLIAFMTRQDFPARNALTSQILDPILPDTREKNTRRKLHILAVFVTFNQWNSNTYKRTWDRTKKTFTTVESAISFANSGEPWQSTWKQDMIWVCAAWFAIYISPQQQLWEVTKQKIMPSERRRVIWRLLETLNVICAISYTSLRESWPSTWELVTNWI